MCGRRRQGARPFSRSHLLPAAPRPRPAPGTGSFILHPRPTPPGTGAPRRSGRSGPQPALRSPGHAAIPARGCRKPTEARGRSRASPGVRSPALPPRHRPGFPLPGRGPTAPEPPVSGVQRRPEVSRRPLLSARLPRRRGQTLLCDASGLTAAAEASRWPRGPARWRREAEREARSPPGRLP